MSNQNPKDTQSTQESQQLKVANSSQTEIDEKTQPKEANYLLRSFLKEDYKHLNLEPGQILGSPNRSEQSLLGLVPRDPFPRFNEISLPEEELGIEDEEDLQESARLQRKFEFYLRHPRSKQTAAD